MSIGSKIKQLRTDRGWTQNELANRSGINRGYIANLETDIVVNPSANVFFKLSRAFDIHQNEFFVEAGYIKEPSAGCDHDPSPEQLLEEIQLAVRRLKKKLKEKN